MNYTCAKFGDFSFSRFGFIVRTVSQTDRISTLYSRDYRRREYARSIYNGQSDMDCMRTASAKRSSRQVFKELMRIHSRRHRKSRDEEPFGLLFGRDLDVICHHGKLPPSLTVSNPRYLGVLFWRGDVSCVEGLAGHSKYLLCQKVMNRSENRVQKLNMENWSELFNIKIMHEVH